LRRLFFAFSHTPPLFLFLTLKSFSLKHHFVSESKQQRAGPTRWASGRSRARTRGRCCGKREEGGRDGNKKEARREKRTTIKQTNSIT
jgi:hypothetical protein